MLVNAVGAIHMALYAILWRLATLYEMADVECSMERRAIDDIIEIGYGPSDAPHPNTYIQIHSLSLSEHIHARIR